MSCMSYPYQIKSFDEYKEKYKQSITDPSAFWSDVAQHFTWRKKWDTVLEWNFSEPKIESPCMQAFRTWYEKKGFSQKTINLFVSTQTTLDMNSSYTMSSNLRTWISWYPEQSEDPFICPVNRICDFLADMLVKGYVFNTIIGF